MPDTFTSTAFFKHAPSWYAAWDSIRIDSKDPFIGGQEAIDWWVENGQDLKRKTLIFSDGLDAVLIKRLYDHFSSIIRLSFGWGTNLTNNLGRLDQRLKPLSMVIKVSEINGFPTVKLSDNLAKAMGPPDEIAFYKRAFGAVTQEERETTV